MAGIIQLEGTAKTFSYNGLIAFGTAVADYSTATADTIMKTMKGVGAIPDGSTEWTGEAASMENWLDEAGHLLDVTVGDGTLGFSFEIASTSKEQLERWMGITPLTEEWETSKDDIVKTGATLYGTSEFPIQTLPGLIISQDKMQAFLFPKMQVVGGITYADKKFRLSISAMALYIKTEHLRKFMKIDGEILTE